MRSALTAVTLAASSALAGPALAGVVITMEQDQAAAEAGEPKTQTMYLDQDKLKMTTGHGGMIYRGDLGKVWSIDEKRHVYHEITPESMQQMRSGMQAMMQQRLQNMPEEQRKKIEAMMAQHGAPMGAPGAPAPQRNITFEKAGSSTTVGQWSCTPYRVLVDGKPENQMCVAKLSDVGLSRSDVEPFTKFGQFMSKSIGGAAADRSAMFDFDAMTKQLGFEGFPVQTASVDESGKPEYESTVKSIDRQSVPASTFDLPPGVTKAEMGMGHMGPPPAGGGNDPE